MSILAVLLILPLVGLGVLGVHEYRKEGACFSNLDELWMCRRFLRLVEKGEYAKAAELIDFGQSYREILDVLNWELSDYEGEIHTVELDGETWMVSPWLQERWGSDPDWAYVIYNGLDYCLIPLEAWQQITGNPLEPSGDGRTMSVAETSDSEWDEAGLCYYLLETRWGDFMVSDVTWESLFHAGQIQEQRAETMCQSLELFPESIYLEAKPALEAEARESYEFNQTYYGPVGDMTETEFVAYMERRYAEQMERFGRQGIDLKHIRLEQAYYTEQWNIIYSCRLELGEGQEQRISLEFQMTDAGIYLIGGGYQQEDGSAFLNALSPRYQGSVE